MGILDHLVAKASKLDDPKIAVAAADDYEVLKAISLSIDQGLASFLLYGNEAQMGAILERDFPHLITSEKVARIHTETAGEAALQAVKAVSNGQAHVLMKGNLPTAVILKAVLHETHGLRTGKVLSHVAAFDLPYFDKLFFITDAAMNIAPTLKDKVQIIENAVKTARACGVEQPIVTPLAAVETVNPAMEPTIDAASLAMMNQRGQIKGCFVNGPLALDNAISIEAAKQKGITENNAGKSDILLVPNIESGNILYKSLIYFAQAKVGAIIEGARAPIVLTSRSDSAESKVYSLALAILSAQK